MWCIWYHHIGGDGLKSLSMPFILLCHLLLAGQFVWSQSLFSDKFKDYLCNGAHQEWRPSITGLIFLLTLHHLLVLPSTTHLLSTFPTHLFTFFRKYLKSSTHPNQPSTFTSPLLAHPKIILKVVHYTTSFGNLVKIFFRMEASHFLRNHLVSCNGVAIHTKSPWTSRTECPFDVAIDQWKTMKT